MFLSRFSRSQCHQAARMLQSYLDGELDPRTTAGVHEHLEVCRRCGLEASAYLAIKTAISSTGAATSAVDPDAVDRLVRFAHELSDSSPD
jgi:anti-sigma factor RsiW